MRGRIVLELAAEVAVRADADGVPDLLHLRRALVFLQDGLAQQPGVQEAEEGDEQDAQDGDLLEGIQAMAGQSEDIHGVFLPKESPYFTQDGGKINPRRIDAAAPRLL